MPSQAEPPRRQQHEALHRERGNPRRCRYHSGGMLRQRRLVSAGVTASSNCRPPHIPKAKPPQSEWTVVAGGQRWRSNCVVPPRQGGFDSLVEGNAGRTARLDVLYVAKAEFALGGTTQ